jgi:hypothetical protein
MAGAFLYADPIRLDSVLFAFGPVGGGQAVSLVGDGFQAGAVVAFGGSAATDVVIASPQTIYCTTPAHAVGAVTVTVTNPDSGVGSLVDGYVYQTAPTTFTLTTLPRVRQDSVRITDTLGQPRTCRLTAATAPPAEADVQISWAGVLLFAGTIETTMLRCELQPSQVAWDVDLIDYTGRLNRRRPFGVYADTSISTIVSGLLAAYAPGLTASVEGGLPTATITFDGTADFSACLTQLAQLAGGHWLIEGHTLSFFVTPFATAPVADLVDGSPLLEDEPLPTLEQDYTQIRNRIFVRGELGAMTQRDDIASQATFGIREATVNDVSLTTEEARAQRGDIELANFAQPIPTLTYATRDLNTRTGKLVTAALTAPPILGTFLIQSVTIDQINFSPDVPPRFLVSAAPVRFTFADWMQAVGPETSLGTAPPPAIPPGSITHDQLAGCIESDLLDPTGATPGTYGSSSAAVVLTVNAQGQITAIAETPLTSGVDGADGAPGADGADGAPGADGADGVGVPVGGTTGQVLAKLSATNFDTAWVAPSGGGSGLSAARVAAHVLLGVL